ncbi:MAG: tetratricopeptide repeat protein [Phycisphaeraceae bacterium]|nr:tetratricopeptide repeat protein [Phycisphaerae bacterium]MBX3393344.1 tetratricopeptide repeat protein [Phycisphaeraceae bacterium]
MSTTSPAYLAARRLYDQGRLDECRVSLQRAISRTPGDADLNTLMGGVLVEMGRPEQALYFLERAAASPSGGEIARSILGEAQMHSGRLEDAERSFRSVIASVPSSYSPRINLANLLIRRGVLDEAEEHLRHAAAARPDLFQAYNNLALLLLDSGRSDEAAALVREKASSQPNDPAINRCLANILNYVDEQRPGESLAAHRIHGEWIERAAQAARVPSGGHSNFPDPDRRLRIAYLSPDFREHSVAYFIEPVMRRHDRERFEVFAYSNAAAPDARTEVFKSIADHWRDIARTGDTSAAGMIRADQIDILVDLAGLTHNNRLGLLALKPAPVQMSYCGYPSTTGLSAVDYRLVDQVTDPPGSESRCVERLLYLRPPGSFSCYAPPPGMPEPAPLVTGTPVVFGSFNVLSKVTPPVVETWCRILTQCPGSRLVLKARSLAEPSVRRRYAESFASRGIDRDRVELLGPLPGVADHLAVYGRVAIALDPFPYNGTTTTYEALWMGVPVVTLAGITHAGRVGASILTALGEPLLIARNTDDYVRTACELAADLSRINTYRTTLRGRLGSSPLCDAEGYTRRLEEALRIAWSCWCGSTR